MKDKSSNHVHTSDCLDYERLTQYITHFIKDFACANELSYKEARKALIKALIKAKE